MKRLLIRTRLSIFLFCTFLGISNAQNIFYNEECSSEFPIGSFCSSSSTTTNINVSGLPNLGVDNFGIVEVFIDFNTVGTFFNSIIYLEAPNNGGQFTIVNSEGFSESFPGWQGQGTAEVAFVPCSDYPSTSLIIPDIDGETFQPVDDYSALNNGTFNPNGQWKIKACVPVSDDVPFNIFCARLTFDNICTEAENVVVNNPECEGEEFDIVFDVNPGICPEIWASLDNINYEPFDDLEGNQIFTTDASVTTLYIENTEPGIEGDSDCLPTETEISVSSNDSTLPTFLCPDNFTLFMDENCAYIGFGITDPEIIDNCSGATGTQTFNVTGTAEIAPQIFNIEYGVPITTAPGNEYLYDMSGVGEVTIDWTAADAAGNMVECQQIIVLQDLTPPEWTNINVTVTVECGVDDINEVVALNLSGLTGTDNCGETNLVFIDNTIQALCGASQHNDWNYFLEDENGNQNSTYGSIYINYLDTEPPVITGMNQADVTISCSENEPTPPAVGTNVFSNDACEGDITNDLLFGFSSILGDCTQGQPIEVITYTYTSTDGCDNESIESYTVTIVDDEAPIFDAPFDSGNITLTATCGVDDLEAIVAANIPTASGCSGPADISVSSVSEGTLCDVEGSSNSASNTFILYEAVDDCGNTAFVAITIDYIDFIAPVINGIPADITINCNDDLPIFPTVTASDACAGDVTDLMEYNSDLAIGTCDLGDNVFSETHTWTSIDYCGNVQIATWTVTSINDIAVDLGDDIIACVGETVTLTTSGLSGTYIWSTGATSSSIVVGNAGSYSVTVTGNSGCCSIDEISVSYQNIPDAAAIGGTLDCTGNPVILMGSSTSSGVTYMWTGPGGFTSNVQNPSVSQAGTYTLTVETSAGCQSSDDAVVNANTDVPDISTTGGTINCNITDVTLMGSSSTSGVTYMWTGPNGYTSSQQNPTVNVPGDYNLTVSATNGCIAEGIAVVEDDTSIPTAMALGGTIDCDSDNITLTVSSSDPDATYAWTGPGGYTSSQQNPTVDVPGDYSVSVMSDNGCTNSANTNVTEDIAVPTLTSEGGVIDCENAEIQLIASSTTTGVSYQWIGPNGYSSNMQNPTIDVAGEYTITINAPNGCSTMMMVTVEEDITNPTLSLLDYEINCNQSSVTLTPDTDGSIFAWSGPGGFNSSEETPSVNNSGAYSLTVTGDNGCTATITNSVTEDIIEPSITTANATLDCNNEMINLSLDTDDNLTYIWTGPNGFSSVDQNPEVSSPGSYSVIATGTNGCTSSSMVTIDQDIAIPNVSATGGEINCDANTIQIIGVSETENVTYAWTGPNDFLSNEISPNVGSPGTYLFTVTAPNGCTSLAEAIVTADENLPNITASGGILDCNTTEIQLMGGSTDEGVTYTWTGPNTFESNDQNPTVTVSGTYTLSVISDNGCVSETDVTVTLDDAEPTVIALGGQISCSQSSISLVGNSNDEVSFAWTGPGGYTSIDQNPEVSIPGEYILTVTGTNGCSNSTIVAVTVDDEIPVATLSTPSVDCVDNSVTITVESTEDYSYQWSLDGNIISTTSSVTFSDAGNYSVLITSNNGCTLNLSYTLDADVEALTSDITTVDATSNTLGSASIIFNNPETVLNILWDNGEQGMEVNALSAGIHTVTVTNILGCTYTFSFTIGMSTAVDEIELLDAYTVYPTIVNQSITLEASLSERSEYTIIITDIAGRVMTKNVYESTSNINKIISTQALEGGVYLITLQIGRNMKTTKFVKM